jgi:hypothetical protein
MVVLEDHPSDPRQHDAEGRKLFVKCVVQSGSVVNALPSLSARRPLSNRKVPY